MTRLKSNCWISASCRIREIIALVRVLCYCRFPNVIMNTASIATRTINLALIGSSHHQIRVSHEGKPLGCTPPTSYRYRRFSAWKRKIAMCRRAHLRGSLHQTMLVNHMKASRNSSLIYRDLRRLPRADWEPANNNRLLLALMNSNQVYSNCKFARRRSNLRVGSSKRSTRLSELQSAKRYSTLRRSKMEARIQGGARHLNIRSRCRKRLSRWRC